MKVNFGRFNQLITTMLGGGQDQFEIVDFKAPWNSRMDNYVLHILCKPKLKALGTSLSI